MRGPVASSDVTQSPQELAAALESYLLAFPAAVMTEDGRFLFDMREAKYSLAVEHGRCTLHLWGAERNLVRRVGSAVLRGKVLRLSTYKFGQSQPQTLELTGDNTKDRRSPSTREATRVHFLRLVQRVLERQFPEWKPHAFRTAMDLEKSFGPAYARGMLVQREKAWAVIGINEEEAPATIDGILTFGILWLQSCREAGGGKRLVQGLKVIVPRGMGALTLSRLPWLRGEPDRWELWELDQRTEDLIARDPADQGNLQTRLVHAPNSAAARERFAASAARVLTLVPEKIQPLVEQRVRSGTEFAFLLHGLEFARVRLGAAADSFNRVEQVTVGAGANETLLTENNQAELAEMVARLCERRTPKADKRDPLYRMQPERWLESALRHEISLIDTKLDEAHVYTQVAAFAAGDRAMLDLLSVTEDGRMAVIEVKADEDPQLALQGLDYWVRVRWHQMQNPDYATGLGEFQRHGYFGGVRLSELAPRLVLVAPALRVHPATEIVLRHLSPRVEWTLVALNEGWRERIKVVWRKRSTDPTG